MGKDYLGADQRKAKNDTEEPEKEIKVWKLIREKSKVLSSMGDEKIFFFVEITPIFSYYWNKKILFQALDDRDIALLKSYGQGQYTKALKVKVNEI